ncbi:hypothetical protein V5G24_23060 [Xanthobacter sp. VTT E-85241]|uniref:hypothetical protein n=1 Tax=Roseixanthobacter finlandensis TaxID=3119922 RepID=UPI003728A319
MDWKAAFAAFAALVALLKEWWPAIQNALFVSLGRKLQQGADAQKALEDVDAASRAASRVELMSDADVLRALGERGLRRLPSQPADRE